MANAMTHIARGAKPGKPGKPGAPAPAEAKPGAPAAAGAPAKAGKKKSKSSNLATVLANAPEAKDYNKDNVEIGSKSDKLEFVCSIGDPSQKDEAVLKNAETGEQEKHEFSRIIGYRFKLLEDMQIPDFGTTETFNGDRLNSAKDLSRWIDGKAGETYDFTRVETAALLSKPEFGTVASGGEHTVRLVVSFAKVNSAITNAEDLPSLRLSIKQTEEIKSIKQLPIIDVLEYEPPKGSVKDRGPIKGTKKLLPEFEGTKFAPRAIYPFESSVSRGGSRGDSKAAETRRRVCTAKAVHTLLARIQPTA